MSGGVEVAVTACARLGEEPEGTPSPAVDPARLRRMDRYARNAFIAGSRALAASGFQKAEEPDAATGVFVGSSLGCRVSIAEHALALRVADRVEDLGPSVFARTVHNSAASELAMGWGLGGPCEVIVSGRCAGVTALLLAFDRLSARAAGRLLVVASEGLDDGARLDWDAERAGMGPRALGVPLVETAAAVVLTSGPPVPGRVRLEAATSFFEPGPDRAAERLAAWLLSTGAHPDIPLSIPSADLDGTLGAASLGRVGLTGRVLGAGSAPAELLGVAGVAGAVEAVRALQRGVSRVAAVLVRDPCGSAGGLLFGLGS